MWNDRYSAGWQPLRDPATLAIASVAGSVIGGATSAAGGIMGGIAQKNMYDYQSQVAANNKVIAQQNADYARATGEVEAQQSGMKTRAVVGETLAKQGASGLDVNTGSGLQVRQSEEELGAYDQAQIRATAARKAYGFEVEGMGFQAQSDVYSAAGANAQTAGGIQAFSSLIGGASGVSDKWLKYSQMGIEGFGGG